MSELRPMPNDVRVIIDILGKPWKESRYRWHVQVAAATIARDFPQSFQQLQDLDFSSKTVSSAIFMLKPEDLVSREPTLIIPTTFLLEAFALALCRSAAAHKQSVLRDAQHPSYSSQPRWLMFENMALSLPTRNGLKILDKANKALHACC